MGTLIYVKPERIWLRDHPELKERWGLAWILAHRYTSQKRYEELWAVFFRQA